MVRCRWGRAARERVSALALSGCACACGGVKDEPAAETRDAAGGEDVAAFDAAAAAVVPDACPAQGGAGLPSYASEADGTVTGQDVNGAVCGGEAHITVSPYTSPVGLIVLIVDQLPGQIVFQAPEGATDGLLTGMVQIPSASPGVYSTQDGEACGGIAFQYSLPTSSPVAAYRALGRSDCLGNAQASQGSWTVTLTSVAPYGVDGGPASPYFTPHGTLGATMVGGADGGLDTATLSLAF